MPYFSTQVGNVDVGRLDLLNKRGLNPALEARINHIFESFRDKPAQSRQSN